MTSMGHLRCAKFFNGDSPQLWYVNLGSSNISCAVRIAVQAASAFQAGAVFCSFCKNAWGPGPERNMSSAVATCRWRRSLSAEWPPLCSVGSRRHRRSCGDCWSLDGGRLLLMFAILTSLSNGKLLVQSKGLLVFGHRVPPEHTAALLGLLACQLESYLGNPFSLANF